MSFCWLFGCNESRGYDEECVYEDGRAEGYEKGLEDGKDQGYYYGYDEGFIDACISVDEFEKAYNYALEYSSKNHDLRETLIYSLCLTENTNEAMQYAEKMDLIEYYNAIVEKVHSQSNQ